MTPAPPTLELHEDIADVDDAGNTVPSPAYPRGREDISETQAAL